MFLFLFKLMTQTVNDACIDYEWRKNSPYSPGGIFSDFFFFHLGKKERRNNEKYFFSRGGIIIV